MLGPQRRLRPKTRQMQPGLTINFMRYKPQRRPRPKTRQIVLGGAQQVREGPASTEASPEDEADARKNSQGHS